MHSPTRLIAMIAAGVLLPVIIFSAVFMAFDAQSKRHLVEATALDKARRASNVIDIDLSRSIASLRVLSTSHLMLPGNWLAAKARAEEVRDLNSDWDAVSLVDMRTGNLLFSTTGALAPVSVDVLRNMVPGDDVAIDGIGRRTGHCTCILMAKRLKAPQQDLALIVELDPSGFQQILLSETPQKNIVTAVVDRQGRFIARSLDYEARLGTPATHFVRDAVARGPTGFYSGITYEGVKNYSAYVTSPLTGWSTHIAVSSSLVTGPAQFWWLSLLVAGVAAILFACGLIWYGVRAFAAQRKAEDRLRAAERMEALGQLTGGIAHDFNNMLAVTIGNLQLAQLRLARGGDITKFLDTAMDGARRATELTQRMLSFSRQQPVAPETSDPGALVIGVIDLLERTIGAHITLKSRVCDRPWHVHVDRSQFENALVNLAANARDAMPDGGAITFEVANQADSVTIAVSDNGCGMTAEVARRALEPFYTTKDTGRGTGLGLSQVYGFVRQSGGDMTIDSVPGKGTVVRLILPRAKPAGGEAAPSAPNAAPQSQVRSLDVLLVEDDERVRRMTEASLIELGHRVRTAHNAAQALLELDQSLPDLMVSDIVMPGMNGRRLADKVSAEHPGIAILLVSAYEPQAPEDTAYPRLNKPFTLQSLETAIARVMAARA